MITYEPTFICDGAKVLGQKCEVVMTGDAFSGSLNIQLPRNWGSAIIRGTKYEFCPSCFGWWMNNQRKAPCPKSIKDNFENWCKAANFNYDWNDQHADYIAQRNEVKYLQSYADEYPELKPILQRYANKSTTPAT